VPTIFLLSPAFCGGRRAGILLNTKSEAVTARQFRTGEMSLGRAFAFMSGLYFRGKLAYAERFGEAFVITPTRGLQRPSLPFNLALLREFAVGDVHLGNPVYRRALERDVKTLASRLDAGAQVVLLGSVASGKYVDVLLPILGDRLRYPTSFIGRGDMSRGGLLRPRGPRPPKLDPLTRVAVSWEHESTARPDVPRRGIVEPALRATGRKAGAEGLGPVVDIRLRKRTRVHRLPKP
jgi:hypothetical protein